MARSKLVLWSVKLANQLNPAYERENLVMVTHFNGLTLQLGLPYSLMYDVELNVAVELFDENLHCCCALLRFVCTDNAGSLIAGFLIGTI